MPKRDDRRKELFAISRKVIRKMTIVNSGKQIVLEKVNVFLVSLFKQNGTHVEEISVRRELVTIFSDIVLPIVEEALQLIIEVLMLSGGIVHEFLNPSFRKIRYLLYYNRIERENQYYVNA